VAFERMMVRRAASWLFCLSMTTLVDSILSLLQSCAKLFSVNKFLNLNLWGRRWARKKDRPVHASKNKTERIHGHIVWAPSQPHHVSGAMSFSKFWQSTSSSRPVSLTILLFINDQVFLVLSIFYLMWRNLGTRNYGEKSAYSVFNEGVESLDGTMTVRALFINQLLGRGLG
jgi:hypothetical protein